ncbi:MAG: hypothetical protein J6R95_07130 [Bacteroidales bacterium]|nr:hypothetical protein [Bacteroidales bacterium]
MISPINQAIAVIAIIADVASVTSKIHPCAIFSFVSFFKICPPAAVIVYVYVLEEESLKYGFNFQFCTPSG